MPLSVAGVCLLLLSLSLCSHCRPEPQAGNILAVGSDKPWYCHDLDCPQFTVLNSTEQFEVRYYESGVWVSTDVETYAYAIASTTGFQRLFKYIDGANSKEQKIPMTAPVRTKVAATSGPFTKKKFTVSFFVPPDLQAKPPKPTNPDVYISKEGPFTAFVSQFGGMVLDDWSISGKARQLAEALEAAGLPFEADSFMYSQYDPPFRLTNRHNEVWILAKEGSPTQQ